MMRKLVLSSLAPDIEASLAACWKEGVVAQVTVSIFDCFVIPYGLALGASTQQIGLLVAVPNILASISQLFAVRAVSWAGNRRSVIVCGVAVQAALLLPVPLLPYLPLSGKAHLLVALIGIYRLLGSVIAPAWGSLVSDYLPEGQRGRYFGWRSRVVGIAGLASVAFWGSLLAVTHRGSENLGFLLLFSGALIFRLISLYYMSRMVDIPVQPTPEGDFTLWMFLRRFRESNFVKFVFYVAAITFATQLSSPYANVFMLRDLKFGYLSYTAVQFASTVAGLLSFPVWGRHLDAVGSARILKSTGMLIPLIPFLWVFARRPAELVLIELFCGFVWSGFSLATTNFIYDAVSQPKRVRCIAYFSLIQGSALFAGASLGGWLAARLPPLSGYRIASLLLLSFACRVVAYLVFSRGFQEVRTTRSKASSSELLLSVLGLRPLA